MGEGGEGGKYMFVYLKQSGRDSIHIHAETKTVSEPQLPRLQAACEAEMV